MMPTEKEQASFLPWVIIAVLGVMLWQRNPSNPKPEPEKPNVEKVVQKMMADVSAGYAKEFEQAAASVGNGEITNEEQLHKQLKERLDDVRSAASVDLNSLLDDRIPTEFDDGNRGAVTTFLKSVANGFQ